MVRAHPATSEVHADPYREAGPTDVLPKSEILSCRVKGFYPFSEVHRLDDGVGGLFGWLFKDTHQAVVVRTSAGSARLFMDFMTEGGQSNPVWWCEAAKWHVFLGGDIRGEVRIRASGSPPLPGSKLARLRTIAEAYDCRMNLYTSNCRIFAACMQREVDRLNSEDDATGRRRYARELAADGRLVFAILSAGLLPTAYPLAILLLCWEGLKDL